MFKRLLRAIAPLCASTLLRILWSTYRVRVSADAAQRMSGWPHPCVLACWHDQVLASAQFLRLHLPRLGQQLALMISDSEDGEIATRVVNKLGFTVVRGSASRNGSRALRQMFRSVTKDKTSPLILPDGPRGPARVAKPGAVALAQMANCPIQPIAFRVSHFSRLTSWDRLIVPWPGARIDVLVGEPLEIPRDLGGQTAETLSLELARRLDAIRETAETP